MIDKDKERYSNNNFVKNCSDKSKRRGAKKRKRNNEQKWKKSGKKEDLRESSRSSRELKTNRLR